MGYHRIEIDEPASLSAWWEVDTDSLPLLGGVVVGMARRRNLRIFRMTFLVIVYDWT